ncbi:hypothetical protein BGZ70_004447 [Mortierella alpina]|uniref:ABC transporter domain-containing protein n=1 Tax=Mortierella alpina TaxID=64518 RepID=A0A9P6JA34_MORAP|nr:hypothetical protein BGZ70_004447 [Mortierella alpina]
MVPPQNPTYQPQTQYQARSSTAAPSPTDPATSLPLGNSSVRTNTVASAANTVTSGISHFSTASHNTVATNATLVPSGHGYPGGSENSLATLIPPPTPSSTFINTNSAAVPAPAEPVDQLSNLNQMDDLESRFDAPLPPLPPSAASTPTQASMPAPLPAPLPAPIPTPAPMPLPMAAAAAASTNNASAPVKSNDPTPVAGSAVARAVAFGPVTCSFLPGEKVAVVGKAKSGKTTFIQSLFRIWDSAEEDRIRSARAAAAAEHSHATNGNSAQNRASTGPSSGPKASPLGFWSMNKAKSFRDTALDLGEINVDGLDISQMGLADLRSRFAYLSQRGTVFAGTVRFNLDPKGEHEDAELNDVLKTCFLSERLKLDTELITPATANLSIATSTGSSNGAVPATSSRVSRYRKHFFRRSRAYQNSSKGKSKALGLKNYRATASAPATVGKTSGRGLQTGLDGNGPDLSHLDQRLARAVPGDGHNQEHMETIAEGDDDETDDEVDEDDTRVELDTNERQLLSLARILVQRPNVVVLDNCASKVTDLTAQRLDQIILQELAHATILSVGHRLDQIIARHNRILVLEQGRIAEFDTPMTLLNKVDGVFRTICNPSGPNFSSLVALAKKQELQQ